MSAIASQKQVGFICSLIDTSDLRARGSVKVKALTAGMTDVEYAAYCDQLKLKAATLTKAGASEWITALKRTPAGDEKIDPKFDLMGVWDEYS